MQRIYRVERSEGGVAALVLPATDAGPTEVMAYHLPLIRSSLGGEFGYGYHGGGSALLAACIVADLFGECPTAEQWDRGWCRAFLHSHGVNIRFVARMSTLQPRHELVGDEVLEFCRQHEDPCEICQRGLWRRYDGLCFACGGLGVQLRL